MGFPRLDVKLPIAIAVSIYEKKYIRQAYPNLSVVTGKENHWKSHTKFTMTRTESQEQSGNVFRMAEYNEAYWEEYMSVRADYSDDFYEQIIEFHKAHNQGRTEGVAHDVGTGPGQVATELAKHFDLVVGSDTNDAHIAIAANRVKDSDLRNRITWDFSGAEDLWMRHPPRSASMLTAAECLPLLDVPRAMNSFAELLRPGGTLAIWFYGRLHFSEPEYAAKCQPIFNDIIDMTFARSMKNGNQAVKDAWKNACDTLESWLDNVAMPSDVWQNVHRYKWNTHLAMTPTGPNACDFPIEVSSAVDEREEKIIKLEDPRLWEKNWNHEKLRKFVDHMVPSFQELKENGAFQHIEPKYQELEEAMGGKDAKRSFTWPVVLILATRA